MIEAINDERVLFRNGIIYQHNTLLYGIMNELMRGFDDDLTKIIEEYNSRWGDSNE